MKHYSSYTKEEMSMALSWARGELMMKDITSKFKSSGSAYIFLASALRDYVQQRDDEDDSVKLGNEDPRVEDMQHKSHPD